MSGAFQVGDSVLLVDHRGRETVAELTEAGVVRTAVGEVAMGDLVGHEPGEAVVTSKGKRILAVRPTLAEAVVHMPRGAQIIYPKDALAILGALDVAPGQRVLECGVGSGGLTVWLARLGASVVAVERRPDFARRAEKNVARLGGSERVSIIVGELADVVPQGPYDRVVLDMVHPWEVIPWIGAELAPGGRIVAYVTNALQIHETVEALEASGYVRIEVRELLERRWVARGEIVRPELRMVAHTGFIVSAHVTPRARRLAAEQPREISVSAVVDDSSLDESAVGADDDELFQTEI